MHTGFYRDALNSGMTANAFKLGSVLYLGWFWPRLNGCSVLYRSDNIANIDLENIVSVVDYNANQVMSPQYNSHEVDAKYYYLLRRANGCGDIEQTFSAVTKIELDGEGDQAKNKPNSIFTLKAEIVDVNQVTLVWFYSPLNQQSKPDSFNVYSDNGSGTIDYESPVTNIRYQGRKYYSFVTESLLIGQHLFAIATVDAEGNESAVVTVSVEIVNEIVPQIQIVELSRV